MNQKGQALVETAVIAGLILFLSATLLRSAYMAWANLIVDRENHQLVLCTLRRRETASCARECRLHLPKLLFGFANIKRVQNYIDQNAQGYFRARGDIWLVTDFGDLRSQRALSEEEIPKVSQRWRW
jgi:hypothetical protein